MTTATLPAVPMLKLSAIRPSPTNPRLPWAKDTTKFTELVESIRKLGVLQPVLVRPAVSGAAEFELVAGHRRYAAAKVAGLTEIPANIRVLDDREALEIQIEENQKRQDLHPLEEGEGYRRLHTQHGVPVPEIAKKVSMSPGHVYGLIKLYGLARDRT